MKGVNYLQENYVIHFDIKPDNILMCLKEDKILIGDFGSAVKVNSHNWLYIEHKGTRGYQAPEILQGRGGTLSDSW